MSFWKKLFGGKESPRVEKAPKTTLSSTKSHLPQTTDTPPKLQSVATRVQPASIHDAARVGDLKCVKELLKDQPDLINTKDDSSLTPLHWAAWKGHKEVLELLLTNGANINVRNSEGKTPFDLGVWAGHKDMSELLRPCDQSVFFHEAVIAGDLERAKALLKEDTYLLLSKNKKDDRPLHLAAEHGQKEMVELLLNSKADVNIKNGLDQTPLFCAAEKGHKDVMKLLIANGADVNAGDLVAYTPLHYAAVRGDKNIVEFLLANGANVNRKTMMMPLHMAAANNRKDVAELLLAKGAKVNARDNSGQTPFDWAMHKGHKEMADFLRQQEMLSLGKSIHLPSSAQSAVKDEELSFEALVEELVTLSQTGYDWGREQNQFPPVKDYPQYARIRKLGELVHAKAGLKGMQEACQILQQKVITRPGDGGGQYLAEHGWVDIGGWRP